MSSDRTLEEFQGCSSSTTLTPEDEAILREILGDDAVDDILRALGARQGPAVADPSGVGR